ncbi:hypothetical protein DSM106972_039840 [Dulcicalothrix desertica PCC 7102]|uniref:DUF928 domain-containing protein n=1 Tax=Dulcicalothrix desertica PCC 7102 TaxID=232991 RepID=A0A3S1B5D3_9CYAN|nr:hypothetical protein [Dulcicalothrix desertica]RUT05163.1 hypothetical protein DSM106972_039840 [Dulcicalothrix desertica PCC 7102]TWH43331.1 hypothetical protein CAL7102_07043 [Dulcicalothrix desertica PCC 7102]
MLNINYRLLLIILPLIITSTITSESFTEIKSVQSFAQTRASNLISIWPRRPPRKPKTSRGSICSISPPYGTYIVWHNRPLFLWKYSGADKQVKIVLREYEGNQDTVWEQPVTLSTQKLLYSKNTPLEAGKFYQWRLVNAENNLNKITDWQTIQIMPSSEREKIQSDLQALEQNLKINKAPSEEIALRKAAYFSNYQIKHQNSEPTNLWSDVLQLLHEINNPSAEYTELLKKYTDNFCQQTPTQN